MVGSFLHLCYNLSVHCLPCALRMSAQSWCAEAHDPVVVDKEFLSIAAMAEELEEVMRKFDLSEKEEAGIQIAGDDIFQGVAECKMSIIGKVIGEKVANITGIKSFTSNIWIFAKNVKVVEIGVNLFQFIFMNQHDMDRVLSGRP